MRTALLAIFVATLAGPVFAAPTPQPPPTQQTQPTHPGDTTDGLNDGTGL
ncbi:MAG: hypothetical protein ACRYGR_09390 [Janthinobacterium lividum]